MKYRMEYDGLDRIALLWGSCQRKVSEVIGRTYFFQIFENSIINGRTETHNVLFSDSNPSSVKPARATTSKPSDGEFSEWLRFSGLPNYESTVSSCQEQPLTLSDIAPPPDQLRLISEASTILDELENESVLESIYAKLPSNDALLFMFEVNSGSKVHQQNRRSMYPNVSYIRSQLCRTRLF